MLGIFHSSVPVGVINIPILGSRHPGSAVSKLCIRRLQLREEKNLQQQTERHASPQPFQPPVQAES